jgi:hypothetical protein
MLLNARTHAVVAPPAQTKKTNFDEQPIETTMAEVESDGEDSITEILDGVQEGEQPSTFQAWFENDRNVIPSKRIPYLMMMMMTIDRTFSLDVPPFTESKKVGLRPTLKMYKTEVKRRDPRARSSRNQPERSNATLSTPF